MKKRSSKPVPAGAGWMLAVFLTDEGRTRSQIRDEIVRGAWSAIGLEQAE